MPELGIKAHCGNVSFTYNHTIPSLLSLPSLLIFYHVTSKTLAVVQLLQFYLYTIWEMTITFHDWQSKFIKFLIVLILFFFFYLSNHHTFLFKCQPPQYTSVYPTKISTRWVPTEDSIDTDVTLSCVVSSAPLCQSLCWSNLLKLRELWLAISAIMYHLCIIDDLQSLWLSSEGNMRGESHPAITKPRELVLW